MPVIAITGAGGFIGQRVVSLGLSLGWNVRGLCRDSRQLAKINHPQLSVSEWDLRADSADPSILEGVDSVCHVAAFVPPDLQDVTYASECFGTNAAGTARLLDAASKAGVQSFVYLSTIGGLVGCAAEVLGRPATESDALHPSAHAPSYITSKIAGEMLAACYDGANGMSVARLRLSSVYGIGMRESSLVPQFLANAQAGRELRLKNGGQYAIDLVYADDVAWAALEAARRRTRGVFNIAAGRQSSLLEVATTAVEVTGASRDLITIELPSGEVVQPLREVDNSTAKLELAWEPTSLPAGMQAMLNAS